MSIILDFLGFTVLLMIQFALLFYVLTGVPSGGCKCPSSINVFLIGTDSCAFMYNPPYSSSADDAITAFITLDKTNFGPFVC